jgi:uncharacterized protein (DUF885 family)
LQQFLGRLQAIPDKALTGRDRLSYRLLDWQLRDEIASADIISTFYSVNQLIGGHLNIFSAVAIAPANTVKDYENQIARLRALPRWVDQTIAAANLAIAEKKIQPRLVADREAVQLDLEMVAEPLQSPLLKAFTKFPDAIPSAEQERLRASPLMHTRKRFSRRGTNCGTMFWPPTFPRRAIPSDFRRPLAARPCTRSP